MPKVQRAVLWGQGLFSHLCVPGASFLPLLGLAPVGAQLRVRGRRESWGLEGGRGGMGRGNTSVQVLCSLVPFAFP